METLEYKIKGGATIIIEVTDKDIHGMMADIVTILRCAGYNDSSIRKGLEEISL